MDMTSASYATLYFHAYDLFKRGQKGECLDICWGMRLEPDLSLYRRALVNLLIARSVDIAQHPDATKFAQECIDLMAEVKAQGFSDDPDYLEYVAHYARNIKVELETRLADQALHQQSAASGGQNVIENELDPAQLAEKEDDLVAWLEKEHGPVEKLWLHQHPTIEGMYQTPVFNRPGDTILHEGTVDAATDAETS